MIHHVSFGVSDLAKSTAFYTAVLEPLGYRIVYSEPNVSGYGREEGSDPFYITQCDNAHAAGPGSHLAFAAERRQAVDAFHARGLALGGKDNGAPGIREAYSPDYYAAFLIDPDGHHIEAVCDRADPEPER